MQFLIGKSPLFEILAFPDDGCFVASPVCEVAVQAVIRNICLRAQEPFREWCIRPIAYLCPLLEPINVVGLFCPESVRILCRRSIKVLILLHRLDGGVLAELL